MVLEMTQEMLISMVKGTLPYFDAMGDELVKPCGYWNDQHGWCWNEIHLKKLSDDELFEIYKVCRRSWK